MPDVKAKNVSANSIVQLVVRREAVSLVRRFKEGAGVRKLANDHGLSRTGVEDLIRSYGWLRAKQKVRAR